MYKETILLAEKEIDSAFGNNKLKEIGFAQAVWTLLSIAEEHYLKFTAVSQLKDTLHDAYVDNLINSLSYPLRVCYKESNRDNKKLKRELIEEDYKSAIKWIDDASDYGYFCSIFPFWHRGKIDIEIDGYNLIPTDWTKLKLEYEAYNRLIRKDGKKEITFPTDETIVDDVISRTKINKYDFYVNFNPKLVARLISYFSIINEERYNLPEDWQFYNFTIGEFKLLYTTIQSMLYGWFIARIFCYKNNIPEYGYRSAVLVIPKSELVNRLLRYTRLNENTIKTILTYLSYGSMGIREPDIAIQPLVDLDNGSYALSPFVWINTNPERNLCVLLNQIAEEKKVYAKLINEKETLLRNEIEEFVNKIGYEVKYGKVKDSNLDCAIIDRNEKTCLALELKWFIEPAEIREVVDKSEELIKGINQAKIIKELFYNRDEQMLNDVLKIDANYSFYSAVASTNWIGEFDIQDDEIVIVKVWHLLNKLNELKSLEKIFEWLSNRDYLPKREKDFSVIPVNISFGKWNSTWYGLKPA